MFQSLSTFIRPPKRKYTLDDQTAIMPVPRKVRIALSQHIGAPCSPTVQVGDEVKVGQIIANSDAFVSAPIHASVSGKVEGITDKEIIITTDGKQTLDPTLTPPKIEKDEDFIQAVKNSGLVGLGGAGFPTYVKINFTGENKNKIDTLLVNGAECEPYITADAREILENVTDVLDGAKAIAEFLEVNQALIGIEDHNKAVIHHIEVTLAENKEKYGKIALKILPSQYPQGAEKVLIETCTGRVVPLGKLPSDVGVVVANIATVANLARFLKTGIPLVSKRVTVNGGAITEPKNVMAPIGTEMKDIIQFCGGYQSEVAKLLHGGPMMGQPLSTDETPINKRTNAIIAFDKKEAARNEESECIRCARCVDICPMNLMPVSIDQSVRAGAMDNLQNLNLAGCIECGLCSFICPSNRQLVQHIRSGKAMLRELAAAK